MRERPVSTCKEIRSELRQYPLAALLNSLLSLTDSLTGLERILTTPIPFSYSIHLWVVTTIYCLALPFQIWKTMNWITIPGTTIVARRTVSIHVTPQTDNCSTPGFRFLRFLGCR